MENSLLPMILPPAHSLTICPHPFLTERVNRLASFGMSLQEIVDSFDDLPKECAMTVQVNGTPIRPELWSMYYPPEGSYIAIRVLPMGGGDDGKMPLRILMTVAVIVASYFTYGAALKAMPAIWAAAAVAGVSMAGNLLINALCPPASSTLTERAGINLDGVVNSITGARNQSNPFGPIPVLLGHHIITPFYAARPYTEIVGNDQYLRLLFVPSYAPVILSDFKIGETKLDNFEDVEIQVKQVSTEDNPTLYTNTVYEEAVNIELLEASSWTQRTTQIDTDEIIIDIMFPNGLFAFTAENDRVSQRVDYAFQYAVKDSGEWIDTCSVLESPERSLAVITKDILSDTIFRVLFNIASREVELSYGAYGLTNPYFDIYTDPDPPPIPRGYISLAQIKVPTGATQITDAMITDERNDYSSKVFEIENAGDFLVTATDPISASVTIAAGTSTLNPGIETKTSEVIRDSYRIKVPQGQYDVRLRRVTEDRPDERIFDDLYWSVLRSVTYESPVTIDNIALIALRIKATDQLNGIIDTFNCIGTSICKDWDKDTATWIERPTVNPASLYRYVLQHPTNKRAVADAKLDLPKLQEWHEFCSPVSAIVNVGAAVDKGGGKVGIPCTDQPFSTNETVYLAGSINYNDENYSGTMPYGRFIVDETSSTNEVVITATYVAETFTGAESLHAIGKQYNSLIDYQTSLSNILQEIAAAGMASPTYIDGKYSVVIDQPQTTPIQHFTPRNSWEFSGSRSYPRIPHALRIIFANSLVNWNIDERIVYSDGYTAENATLYEQLELPGTTNPELAYVLARYHLATLILRPEKYSFYADVENLVATRGDLIRVTHDVPLWGIATGRVTGIVQDESETHITGVVMDSVMSMTSTRTYSLRLRLADGSSLLLSIVPEEGDFTTLMLVTPILSSGTAVVDQLGMFGESGEESVELLILAIEPGEDLTAKITCIDYAPDVYTASVNAIGEHDSHITPPYGPIEQVGYPKIYQIRSDESVMFYGPDGVLHTRIVITLEPAGGYLSKIAFTELSVKFYGVDGPWYPLRFNGFMQEIAYADVIPGTEYSIRLRYVLHNGEVTSWTTAVQHTIVGKTSAPAASTSVSATTAIGGIRLEWTNPTVIDFKATGIWRAEEDVFPEGDANYVVPGKPGEVTSFIDLDVEYNTTYYYWLKSYDTSGNVSTATSSVTNAPSQVTEGDIFDTIQSENFVSGVSGWFIGFRGANDGYAEFNDVLVRGELVAGEIHIPDKTTANSFHVDVVGNAWWGCNEADFASSVYNAKALIQSDGSFIFFRGYMGGWGVSDGLLASYELEFDEFGDPIILSNNIVLDAENQNIRSGNYVTGSLGTGFKLSSDLFEVNNITARGTIKTAVFEKTSISALGGSFMVLPADTISYNMTAADDNILTVQGNETFAIGDILRIREAGYDEWLLVTNDAYAPTYIITRDLAGAYDANNNPMWPAGSTVVNYGASGEGAIYMTGSDPTAPYLAIFTHTGSPWSSIDVHVIMGNLNGFYGYESDTYGIAFGGDTEYLTYDPAGGLTVSGTVNILNGSGISNFTDAPFLAAPGDDGLYITAAFMGYYKDSTWTTYIGNDGVFAFAGDANNYITWDGDSLTIMGIVNITNGTGIANFADGGFLAAPSDDGLYISSAYMGYYKSGVWTTYIADNGVFAFSGDADNYITWNGTSLIVKGVITVTSGTVGDITLSTSEGVYAGADATRVQVKAGAADVGGIWTGGTLVADAKNYLNVSGAGFLASGNISWNASGAITLAGSLTSTATITGGTIQTAASGARSVLNSSGLAIYDATTQRASIGSDGSGWLGASNVFSWTTEGVLTLSGFTPGTDDISITNGANTVIISSGATAFSAGPTGSPTFTVTQAGELVATLATITGAITATSGSFSGAITASTIDIGGADTTSFHIDTDGNIWLGAASYNLSTNPFAVSNAGVLRAVSGTIGGWTLATGSLSAGNLTFDSTNTRIQCGAGVTDYVRITPSGITGVSATLGTTFDLPSDGSAPTFSSGIIQEAVYEIYTSGIIRTAADPSTTGGVLINSTGIKGYNPSSALTFHLDASTGILSAKGAIITGSITGGSLTVANSGDIILSGNDAVGNKGELIFGSNMKAGAISSANFMGIWSEVIAGSWFYLGGEPIYNLSTGGYVEKPFANIQISADSYCYMGAGNDSASGYVGFYRSSNVMTSTFSASSTDGDYGATLQLYADDTDQKATFKFGPPFGTTVDIVMIATGITVPDGYVLGLGPSAGRISFVDAVTDYVNFLGCNVGIGATIPTSPLVVKGTSASGNDASGVGGILRLSTGTGLGTDNSLMFGVHDGDFSWIQASNPGTAYRDLVLQPSGGNVGINETSPTSKLHVTGLSAYANNAAAVSAGLTAGAFYRTGGDPDTVCVVH